MKQRTISILGSTGSIGTQSIDVCRMQGYRVAALTADKSVEKLEAQARLLLPEVVAMRDEKSAADLAVRLADTGVRVLAGEAGVCECAALPQCDTVVNAIVGLAGLKPTLEACKAGKRLALANKETLVSGGDLVKRTAKANGAEILPVDSEHSAIFQCLEAAPPSRALKRIILTASGGPFFGKTRDELRDVTCAEALKHPNWAMGAKITVDSATMFNKGLELIEAVRLFDVTPDQVKVVVHRESILHSAVEFADNAVIAQLGLPDMRIPIQYAITYPERVPSPTAALDLAALGKMTFFEPDNETFPCLSLCAEAVREGGLRPCAVNAANEVVNLAFRQARVRFLDIPALIRAAADRVPNSGADSLDAILDADAQARAYANESIGG